MAQLAREALPLEIPREAELVCIGADGARIVKRPLAELVLDRFEHDHIRALEILAAQLLWIERDRETAEVHVPLLVEPVHRLQVRHLLVGIVEQLARRLGPGTAPVHCRGPGRVEGRERPPLELAHIPVGVGERQVHDGHVLADVLDFLRIPQGEGGVVACRHEDAIRLGRLQEVEREVARQGLALA